MTAREMAELLDRTAWYNADAFMIEVQVCDVRVNFGQPQVLIRPVNGRGEKWTPLQALALIGQ